VSGVIIFHYTMVSTAEVKTQIAQLEQQLLVASPDEKPQLEEELQDLKSKAQFFPVGGYVVLASSVIAFLPLVTVHGRELMPHQWSLGRC